PKGCIMGRTRKGEAEQPVTAAVEGTGAPAEAPPVRKRAPAKRKPPASKAAPEGLPELTEAARAALLALEQQGKSTAEQLAGAEGGWGQGGGGVREAGRNLAGHLQDLLGGVRREVSELRELLVALRGEVEPAREGMRLLRDGVTQVGRELDALRSALR